MNNEELAVIIHEECASRTRTTKECVEGIKLRTGLVGDFDDTIRRYRQSGSGLEKATLELISLSDNKDSIYTVSTNTHAQQNNLYDSYLTLFRDKNFAEPETASKLVTLLKKKGLDFDINLVEEVRDCEYRCLEGIQIGDSCYFLDSVEDMKDSAVESVAESISRSAWDMARDEVENMDTLELLERSGWYDGVISYDRGDTDDEIIIER